MSQCPASFSPVLGYIPELRGQTLILVRNRNCLTLNNPQWVIRRVTLMTFRGKPGLALSWEHSHALKFSTRLERRRSNGQLPGLVSCGCGEGSTCYYWVGRAGYSALRAFIAITEHWATLCLLHMLNPPETASLSPEEIWTDHSSYFILCPPLRIHAERVCMLPIKIPTSGGLWLHQRRAF